MTDTKRTEQEPEMDEWLLACRTLEAAGVRYVVVGAFGAELHFLRTAVQISTHDMDVLLPMSWQQVLKALDALGKAGFTFSVGDEGLIPDEVQARGIVRNGAMVKAERGDHSVDLMTELQGHHFEALWERQSEYVLKGVPVRVAPLDAIIQSKQEAGRMKDRLFLEQFREVIEAAFAREAKRRKEEPPSS